MGAPSKVNYIRHLNAFYVQVRKDDRLKSSHISLYMALFQRWNTCQFRQAFPVLRERMMRLSGIGSRNTYTQCLKDLDAFGYIRYRPGGKDHPLTVISIAYLFEPAAPAVDERQLSLFNDLPPVSSLNFNIGVTRPKNGPVPGIKNEPPPGSKMGHYNKHVNNNKTEGEHSLPPSKKNKKVKDSFEPPDIVSPRAPDLIDVKALFSQNKYPAGEALKFFHHYQANGWKQAGKTPISDWQAAAHKWVLNIHDKNHSDVYRKSQSTPTAGRLHSNPDKDYSDPL